MNFSDAVFNLCKIIPKGKVSTYKEIAEALNCKAYRAVGSALNKNQNKDVPCHRIVGVNGNLVGFAYGLEKKRELLENEGVKIMNNKVVDFEEKLFKFK